MEHLPNFGLANTVTGFCTLFAGLLPLWLCKFMAPQPARWIFAYAMIALTGVFTITLHGFGETNPMILPRWIWAFLDTGSNIVVAWAIGLAILWDYYAPRTRKIAAPLLTLFLVLGLAWHFFDRMHKAQGELLIGLGGWGGFNPGETWLIGFSILNTILFYAKYGAIPKPARPLLNSVQALLLVGLVLASASNETILWPFLPLHALWHVVGAVALVMVWAFNHKRLEVARA